MNITAENAAELFVDKLITHGHDGAIDMVKPLCWRVHQRREMKRQGSQRRKQP